MEADNTRIIASTPMIGVSSSKLPKGDKHDDKVEKDGAKKDRKTTLEKVCEAIEAIGDRRKGASYTEIKKYILSRDETEPGRLRAFIKKAVLKGLETGDLQRTAASKNASGVIGSFKLGKPVTKPKDDKVKAALKKLKTRKERVSDSEGVGKASKPRKLILSDADIEDFEDIAKTKGSKGNKPKPAEETAASEEKVIKAKKTEKGTTWKVKGKKSEAQERKDLSDSEVVVKKKIRPSLKSYASDPEVGDAAANKKTKKDPEARKASAKNPKGSEQPPKAVKAKKTEKGTARKVKGKKSEAQERRDVSDSEVVVKKKIRPSLKSYASDPEVGDAAANKPKKKTEAKAASAKNPQGSEQPPKVTKTKATKKLFNTTEDETGKKNVKTKTKKTD